MLISFLLFAEENAKPLEPGWGPMMPLLLIGIAFYFLMIRPMSKQEKERKALRANLKKDDKIITTSGMYGVVVSVADKEDEVVIRIADNVRVRMIRAAIDRNLTNEDAAREAKGGKVSSTAVTDRPQ
jgi:preprotein translocase subunit YajC